MTPPFDAPRIWPSGIICPDPAGRKPSTPPPSEVEPTVPEEIEARLTALAEDRERLIQPFPRGAAGDPTRRHASPRAKSAPSLTK